ncbi:MAG: PAS domain S-box protein [Rhodothermales bacterium]|nr:PAS domain S-box protein [Rhodothermales bacterium]
MSRTRNHVAEASPGTSGEVDPGLYRAALDHAAEAVFWARTDGQFVYVNHAACQSLGYSHDELLGMSVADIHHGHTDEGWSSIRQIIRRDGLIAAEAAHRRKDGSIFPVELRGSMIDCDGEPLVCAFARDITDRHRITAELDRSTLRYRSFVEQSRDAIFCYEYDPPISTSLPAEEQIAALHHGILVECNTIAAQSYGSTSVDEVIGRSLQELFGVRSRDVDGLFRAFVEGGYEITDGASSQILPDGSVRHFLNNGVAEVVDGGIIRVWGTYRDVTDQKLAEDALRSSENRFSAAFYANPDPMTMSTLADGRLLVVNEAFLRATGFTRDEVIGETVTSLRIWAEPRGRDRLLQQLQKGSGVAHLDARIRMKSGEVRFGRLTASTLLVDGESCILMIMKDLTDLRKAVQAREQSEARFATAFRSSPHLLAITSLDQGVLIDINEGFERVSGYSRSEALGRSTVDLNLWVDPNIRSTFAEALRESGRVQNMEVELRTSSGDVRTGLISAEPIEVEGKQCIISLLQDITERKHVEDALRRSEEKFSKAFHSTPHLVAITSLETGTFIDINEGFERVSGYSRAEVVGRRTDELNMWVDPLQRSLFVDTLRKTGRVHEMEVEWQVRSGERRGGLISGELIEVDGRECVLTIVQDITERKKSQDALKAYAARLKTLRDVDTAIVASDSIDAIVTVATAHLFELPGCSYVACFEYESDGQRMRRVGVRSRTSDGPEFLDVDDHVSVLRPLLNGELVLVNDIEDSPLQFSQAQIELVREVGVDSFFMVPLAVNEQRLGALVVAFATNNGFAEDHVELAREIASPLAVAIEKMRLQEDLRRSNRRLTSLSRKLVEAQELERRNLAHELHDHIGQMLTAAKISLQEAREIAVQDKVAAALDEHIEIVGETLEQIRSLSLELRPSLLDDFGLVPALKWLIGRQSAEAAYQITLAADLSMPRLPNEVEVTCFRVAQEALANVARHASPGIVQLEIERRPDRVVFAIIDDGVGFDVEAAMARASSGNSLGLLSMSERARLVGGVLHINSVVGKGTTVEVELPLLSSIVEP